VDSFIDAHAAQRLRDKMDPNAPGAGSFDVPDSRCPFRRKSLSTACNRRNWRPLISITLPLTSAPRPNGLAKSGSAGGAVADASGPTASSDRGRFGHDPTPSAMPMGAGSGAKPGNGKDVRLVVAAFHDSMDDLYTQWNTSFGPTGLGQPPRLAPADFRSWPVTAYRSEMVNDVDQGSRRFNLLTAGICRVYPPPATRIAEVAIFAGAAKAPKTIVAPDFPTIIAGAVWKDPVLYLTPATNTPNDQAPRTKTAR
jgi:hypothetical protein